MTVSRIASLLVCLLAVGPMAQGGSDTYPWLSEYDSSAAIKQRVTPLAGYRRVKVDPGSFASWLRGLPLKDDSARANHFDGRPVSEHDLDYAVVDLHIGESDLLQCADAVIRLRSEYLFGRGDHDQIAYRYTNGDTVEYSRWRRGFRPQVVDGSVVMRKAADVDTSYRSFRTYLDSIFMYAGTYSLKRDMKRVPSVEELAIGDVFILGGFPGHAVMVVDKVVNDNGDRLYLLLQGFMPAQDVHIISNEADSGLNPWFRLQPGDTLSIHKWEFTEDDLRRF